MRPERPAHLAGPGRGVRLRRQLRIDQTLYRCPRRVDARFVDLVTAQFVLTHGGVLLIGPPGIGKSHCVVAIAVGAIRAGYRVLVRSTFDLVRDFAEAEAAGQRHAFVQTLTRVDLLVLETLG